VFSAVSSEKGLGNRVFRACVFSKGWAFTKTSDCRKTQVSLFVLRARQPDAERPFRAWGYPIVPGVYVVASVLILGNGLYTAPGPTGAGAVVILAGIPIYLFCRRDADAGDGAPPNT